MPRTPYRRSDGSPLPPTDTFHIEFDTKRYPGMIVATKVTIREEIVSDMNTVFRLDLSDHPLYRRLANYVRKNGD